MGGQATETATSDTDGDGLISSREFQKLGTQTTFVCLDADANGYPFEYSKKQKTSD